MWRFWRRRTNGARQGAAPLQVAVQCAASAALRCLAGLYLGAAGLFAASVQVDHRVFPGLHQMDGNWAALLAASDGKVYAGLAYHGSDGHLVYYDSKTDRVVDVANLTELTGESQLKRGPQSKILMRSTTRHSSASARRRSMPSVGVVTPRSKRLMKITFERERSASSA